MQEQVSEFFIYIKGVLQYKWFAIVLAWMVHVDTKTLLQPLLRGIAIHQDGQGLVILMKKLMFTVPNLEKIVALSNLDSSVTNDLERAKMYEGMKETIIISGGKHDGLFNVSYEASDPELAKNVVTAVLTVFSEQTQSSTMEDVGNSQRFINLQIREYEVRLRNAEKAKEAFRKANSGLLPGEGAGQIAKLNATKDQLEKAKLGMSQAISKRDVITKQMQEVVDAGDVWGSGDSAVLLSPEDQQIKGLQIMRMDLLLKYTEAHPAVSTIELTLKELLRRKEQNDKILANSGLPNAGALANPYVQQLKIALNQAETDVASNSTRIEYLQKKIEKIKSQLNARLTVETEMKNINRDYNVISENYHALIERREQARMSEKVDAETESIKFKIADPPNLWG
jgi:polysaccharide chain length determinant protein (PEP-CTERM system associated)